MARKRKSSITGGASWLETYSDMVTLLLTFFIMLYAMSTIDAAKYAMIVEAFSKGNVVVAPGELPEEGNIEETPLEEGSQIEEKEDIDILYKLLMDYVNEKKLNDSVQVYKTKEYVFIRFSSNVTFNGYSNILNNSGKEILDVLGKGLELVDDYIEEVIIAGHTATVENDNTTIDRNLSTERANVVLKHLEEKNVIDPAKYLAIGYGLYSPIADNNTTAGRAKNRRVEIYISRKGYPISYTNLINETINKKEDSKNPDEDNEEKINYQRNKVIDKSE